MARTLLSTVPICRTSFVGQIDDQKDYVVLPSRIVQRCPLILEDMEAFLVAVGSGSIFRCEVCVAGRNVWLKGFEQIRGTYDISGVMKIHFKYQSETLFDIRIFHENEVEVIYDDVNVILDVQEDIFLWNTTLTEALCRGNQALNVPRSVVDEYLMDRPNCINVILPDSSRQVWSLIWDRQRDRQCMLGDGWYQYCRSNHFKLRDQINVYKIPNALSFKVVVHRH